MIKEPIKISTRTRTQSYTDLKSLLSTIMHLEDWEEYIYTIDVGKNKVLYDLICKLDLEKGSVEMEDLPF